MNEWVGAPRIGQWYRNKDKGEAFVVTAIDEPADTIELQTIDGDVDEIESLIWDSLPLETVEPSEDWSGPFDVDPDVSRDSDSETNAGDRAEPFQTPLAG